VPSEPLYKKIVNDLKKKIFLKELAPGDKVPTEAELSKQYGVSRITSKRALSELEIEGLIYRIQGKGSFVKEERTSGTQSSLPKNILFILPFPDSPEIGNYAQGMLRCFQKKNFVLHIQSNSYLETMAIDTLLKEYAGMILYPSSSNNYSDLLYFLSLNQFPLILLDKQLERLAFPAVTADNLQGGYEAALHLIESHHQNIAFLSSGSIHHSSSLHKRYLGFLKALHEKGYPLSEHYLIAPQEETALDDFLQEAISTIKSLNITGLVVEYDLTAIRLMKHLQEKGWKIPQDLAIIGFDDIQASSLISPTLSTVAQNFEDIGYLAAKNLVATIENKKTVVRSKTVPIKLIVRESTSKKKE